jgi:hypothetical protein
MIGDEEYYCVCNRRKRKRILETLVALLIYVRKRARWYMSRVEQSTKEMDRLSGPRFSPFFLQTDKIHDERLTFDDSWQMHIERIGQSPTRVTTPTRQ